MSGNPTARNLSTLAGRVVTGAGTLAAGMLALVLAALPVQPAQAALRSGQPADLAVTLTCPAELGAGTTGQCSLRLFNHGPGTGTGLRTSVTLSPQLAEVSCSGGCRRIGPQQYQWTAASLASGRSMTYTVTVRGIKTGSGPVRAQVAATSHDPQPGNNTASRQVTVYTL